MKRERERKKRANKNEQYHLNYLSPVWYRFQMVISYLVSGGRFLSRCALSLSIHWHSTRAAIVCVESQNVIIVLKMVAQTNAEKQVSS